MDGTQLENMMTPWENCIEICRPSWLSSQMQKCNYDIASTTLTKCQLYICTIVAERSVSLLLHVPISFGLFALIPYSFLTLTLLLNSPRSMTSQLKNLVPADAKVSYVLHAQRSLDEGMFPDHSLLGCRLQGALHLRRPYSKRRMKRPGKPNCLVPST